MQVPDLATGQQRLRDDDLDALLVQSGGTVQVVVKKQLDDSLKSALTVLSRQLAQDARRAAAGGDPPP